jgi:hypothetical protein
LIALGEGYLTVVSSKNHHVIFWLLVNPLFCPANGQIIISTRRWKACRGLLSIAFDRACHSASNVLNIFGKFEITGTLPKSSDTVAAKQSTMDATFALKHLTGREIL